MREETDALQGAQPSSQVRSTRSLLSRMRARVLPDALRLSTSVWVGFIASVLGALSAWAIGFTANVPEATLTGSTFVNALRAYDAVLWAAVLGLAVAVGLASHAWIQLARRLPLADGHHIQTRIVVLWSAPWFFAPPIFSNDMYSYLAQGRLLTLGKNPYTDWVSQVPGWFGQGAASVWAESASPYGPLFLIIAAAVALVSWGNPDIALFLFRLVALVGVIIFMKIIPKLSRDHGVNPAWIQWLTAASPLFLYSMIASGHNDALMVGLMLWAFVAMRRGKTFAGLLLASGAIAIKPIVVLCLPFLGLTWAGKNARWGRRWMCWIVTGITVTVVLTALGGLTGTWFGWITAMAGQGMAIFPFAPFGLLGLGFGHLVSLAGGTQAGLIAQSLFYAAGKLIAIGLAGWLALARPKVSPLTSAGLVLMAASLLNPVIQPWYFYWILPFLLCRKAYFGFVEQLIVWGSTLHVIWTTSTQISLPPWQELGGFQAVFILVATAISVTALAFPRTQRKLIKLPTWTDIRKPADASIVMPTLAPWSVSQFAALRYRSPRVIDERVW
ncbi:polyprenol phosphomannose-dependent alpha 1,6 mannosyltransferase MptB [Pseudoglutamicibacter cumminsii]|uniref:polyprenol phosphomannose-dependent alpha 1,6 mannosyltransferase MptB n=1 Tax=Pseudoglutamicibacter cumminsii TaxID=156979 RepID=UPI00195B8612|nr:polyprenol phosphomannose-dependent alpha 1,6 mannosyltransferase MptB [Pseudoglutamicibacter cumminsii]MBM7796935.1 hypothetical protein [Pseudoglutamicibacter cumminsii]